MIEKIKELPRGFKKFDSEIIVVKKVNDVLVTQLGSAERQ